MSPATPAYASKNTLAVTPVEVVLPRGKHQFTVSKDGYQTYNRTIPVNGNDTVWVKLRPDSDI